MEEQYAAFAERLREAVVQIQLALREPTDRDYHDGPKPLEIRKEL
jgi:hypothetical protein